MEIARSFPGVGTALDVAHWPTRKYKKYRAFLIWVRKAEAGVYDTNDDQEDKDDDTPRWWREGPDDEPDWNAGSFTRVRDD